MSAYAPLFTAGSGITRAPEPLPEEGCFVKKPSLFLDRGLPPTHIADNLLREIEVWELLAKYPHPNIPRYLGCQVSPSATPGEERITGICLSIFETDLMREFNPQMFTKQHARDVGYQGTGDLSRVMDGVESAVKHLHVLGWVHRNSNPQNILLGRRRRQGEGEGGKETEQWEGFLTGMGSFTRIATRIKDEADVVGGQLYEWYDQDDEGEIAFPDHDFDQLDEIRIWLSGDKTLPFKFLTLPVGP